jgi:hypothetical protein
MCYRFELLEFEDCLFENIDATYILHLEGNGRLDHIHEQLKTYHPTKKVYLVYNKGYKCKELNKSTNYDLIHANMTIFEHASPYKHVLVLEDDFIFSPDVVPHATHVDDFLKRDTLFVYQLGSKPLLAIPIDMHHYRTIGLLAHANIYSPLARKQLLQDYEENKMNDVHIDNYIKNVLPVYMYHTPLCYQTFPMTKNRKNWHKDNAVLKALENWFITWTGLDHSPELGFSILYFFAKMVPFLLFLLIWIIPSCLSCTSLKGKRVR